MTLMASKLHCDLCDGMLGTLSKSFTLLSNDPGIVEEEMDLCLEHRNSLRQLLKTWITQQQGGHISPERDWPQKKVGARA